MRNVLFINRIREGILGSASVLAEAAGRGVRVHMVTTEKYASFLDENALPDDATFTVVPGIDLETLYSLARSIGRIDKVVCFSEEDLFVAAALRRLLGIAGSSPDDAIASRDKFLMKLAAARGDGGIRVPKFAELSTFRVHGGFDVERILSTLELPVVLKPKLGMSCSKVDVSRDPSALAESLSRVGASSALWIAEEFVDGEMYHVDTFVDAERGPLVSVSKYTKPPLRWNDVANASASPFGGITLSADDPLRDRLARENAKVLTAMGIVSGCAHVEFFVTPPGEVVLCEIGARFGGGSIVPCIEGRLGVNFARAWLSQELGVPPDLAGLSERSGVSGWLDIPAVAGSVIKAIRSLRGEFPDITHEEMRYDVGKVFARAFEGQERVLSYVVEGEDHGAVLAAFQRILEARPVEFEVAHASGR